MLERQILEKGMSVKDINLDMAGSDVCGNTLADGDAQSIPSDGKAIWLGSGGGGFTHTGPCEIYLDDKMVLPQRRLRGRVPGRRRRIVGDVLSARRLLVVQR